MLIATLFNIHHAHVNMPCEEKEVRNKLIQQQHLTKGEQPLLFIRLGYSEIMPYSFRRPLGSVNFLDTNEIENPRSVNMLRGFCLPELDSGMIYITSRSIYQHLYRQFRLQTD